MGRVVVNNKMVNYRACKTLFVCSTMKLPWIKDIKMTAPGPRWK